MILIVGSLTVLIGLTSLQLTRVRNLSTAGTVFTDDARALAFAAIEHALATIAANESWRGSYTSHVPTASMTLGSGTFRWMPLDPDGNLGDDDAENFQIWGIGTSGASTQVYSVWYQASAGTSGDVLGTVMHASGDIGVNSSMVAAIGGPLSTNGHLAVNGTIGGDADALTATINGTVTGTLTMPAPPKAIPPVEIFDYYKSLATTIEHSNLASGELSAPLLSAAVNPYGATNSNGIYYLHVPNNPTLRVYTHRIKGTLVIDADTGARIMFDQPIHIEPHSPEFAAVLIRSSGCTIELNVPGANIDEAAVGHNLNPDGTPYQGAVDGQLDDIYPSETNGLFHIINPSDNTEIGTGHIHNGVIIVEGGASMWGESTLTADAALVSSPPQGYAPRRVGPIPTSWRREKLPLPSPP
ncbi:MAG: hypothetical protein CMJ18_03940 [Phycisphaeraceae bacterium]|nr:hypothetical protein [Phycisphaeraceae bacterium]